MMCNSGNKKIAIVITGLSFGGAERVTSYLANYFISQGREVYLISLTTGEKAYPLSNEIHIREFEVSDSLSPLARYVSLIRLIRKELISINPSVVLGMMSYSGSLAALANIGLKTPFLISERNDPFTSTGFSEKEKKVLKFVYRHFVTKAVFQSEGAKSFYFTKQDPRGVVIPNPLYLEEMPPSRVAFNTSKRIVSAGRLNFQKNYILLIHAFAQVYKNHPQYSLVIYGEGEEREALSQVIKDHGLEKSVFLPGIEKNLFGKFGEAEMFVLSSNFEGMPNALIEAMAMGLPCITTDYSDGRGNIVEDGRNGLIVPRMDVGRLADAITSLIENPEYAIKLGQEAARIREDLDSNVVCKQWLNAVESTEGGNDMHGKGDANAIFNRTDSNV